MEVVDANRGCHLAVLTAKFLDSDHFKDAWTSKQHVCRILAVSTQTAKTKKYTRSLINCEHFSKIDPLNILKTVQVIERMTENFY